MAHNYWSIGDSWLVALSAQLLDKMEIFDRNERQEAVVYPPVDRVFSWTQIFPIEETKVVILGQKPYHGPGQAHGLSLSALVGQRDVPSSLKNIFTELENDDVNFQRPNHGNLGGWANQGVLLLNSVLTVRQSQPNSHKDQGWEDLTDGVISWISANLDGAVFILWGDHAIARSQLVDTKKHFVLESEAPHRPPPSGQGSFSGCRYFSKANGFLLEKGKAPINWNALD